MADVTLHSELIRQITHDLNGEVFVIRGHAELGLSVARNLEETHRHFRVIMERCDEIAEVVKKLRHLREGKLPADNASAVVFPQKSHE